ncbi:MAG: hypothetical protein IJA59_10680, partial [Clostridia bacterium]|nr:hypothetical protein [Clostridia bacterium]
KYLPQFGIVAQKAKTFCALCLIGTTSTFICQRAAVDSVPRAPPKTSLGLGCFGRLYEKESDISGCEQARSGK